MNQQSLPTPATIEKPDLRKILQTNRIIWAALLVAAPAFLVYRYLVPDKDRPEGSASALVLAIVAVLLLVISTTYLIRAQMFKRCTVDGVLPPSAWQRGNL